MSIRRPMIHFVVLVLIGFVSNVYGEGSDEQTREEIKQLINDFQRTVIQEASLDHFFAPSVQANEKVRIDALHTQGFLTFEIIDYTMKDLTFQDAQHAALPVTVKWSTRTEEASTTTTLRFAKENGTWYFARADFWEVSVGWFVFPLTTFAIAYGITAVVMYRHANRQVWNTPNRKTLWSILSIIPFAPFLYFARKPWRIA
jgi:hypothetical protein